MVGIKAESHSVEMKCMVDNEANVMCENRKWVENCFASGLLF